MKSGIRRGTLALVVLGGMATAGAASFASAQPGSTPPEVQDGVVGRGSPQPLPPNVADLRLSEAQKSAIAAAVRRSNRTVEAPKGLAVSVGAPVPPAMELYTLPDDALIEVPAAKLVKYTVVSSQLVLVDPTTMRIVDVIPQ